MPDPDMIFLGVKANDLVAGLSGGIVNAFVFRQTSPVAVLGSVVVGCLTAGYLSEPASKFFGTTGGATSFLVGLCAMAICQSIVAAIQLWKPGNRSNG